MKKVEKQYLKAMSHCLLKESILIALHIGIHKKKMLHSFSLLGSVNLNFKFGIVTYMKTWLICVLEKRKAEICTNLSSAFLSLHIFYLTFICEASLENCLTKLIK